MDIEPIGHFIVFGATGSGKTYYAKHLIKTLKPKKVFVFAGEQYQWDMAGYTVMNKGEDSFETSAEKIVTECSDHMKKLREEAAKAGEELESSCPFVVVFDDFNDEINTAHNEHYKRMYTKGRHNGIRVINLAHYTHAIGPVARANAKYIAMMCTMPEDEIKTIADIWYGKDHLKLKRYAADAMKEHENNVILFNRVNKNVTVTRAPAQQRAIVPIRQHLEDNIADDYDEIRNMTVDVPLDDNSALNKHPDSLAYNRVGGQLSIGNKSAHNMVDNSKNMFNIDHSVKIDQKIQSNQINNQLKLQNITQNMIINLKQDICDVHELVHKPWNTPEEIQKIVYTLNRGLRPNPPFTIHDYREGIPAFERKFFKNKSYKRAEDKDMFATFVGRAGNMMLAQNNPLTLFNEAYGLYERVKK
jgi:hypothetical protein